MFSRLRRWLRGSKKNVSLNKPTQHKKSGKRDSLRKTKSLHDIVLSQDNEEDGFRKNDLNDFDIVLAGELPREPNNNRSASTMSLVSPQVNHTEPANIASQGKNNQPAPEKEETDKTLLPENELVSEFTNANGNDSLDGSVVDLVTPTPNETEQTSANEQNLTLDEMHVLDIFDSVVHGIEIEEKDTQSEIASLKDNTPCDISGDNADDDEIVSAQQKIASYTKRPVDFAQVFGEDGGENAEVARADNWRISRVDSVHNPIKLVKSNMYLPSRPALPPTDYPETDDELLKGICICLLLFIIYFYYL